MSAQTVIKKIEEIAAAEIAEIRLAGEAKAETAKEAIMNDAFIKTDEIKSKADASAATILRAATQQAEFDRRISILNAKHDLLAEARQAAKEQMLSFSDAEWTELYARLMIENTMPGDVFVKIPKSDKDKYTSELFCAQNLGSLGYLLNILSERATKARGEAVNLHLDSEFADIDGGVILCGEHYDMDLSFDTVLATIFEQHEEEIATCLFGDGTGES